ncbi:serine protease [Patescibacteria group bacterium]|nr:serine protease [Patescibacteria group bacterium]
MKKRFTILLFILICFFFFVGTKNTSARENPVITSISSVWPGSDVTIEGNNFGGIMGDDYDPDFTSKIVINNKSYFYFQIAGATERWRDNKIIFVAPNDITEGYIQIQVYPRPMYSNSSVLYSSNQFYFTLTPLAPLCTINNWSCTSWSLCSSNGAQIRTCSKNSNCEGGTQSPATTQSCVYTLPCSADTWQCGDWSTCVAQGIQTRICNKTYDCAGVDTSSPQTSQPCTYSSPNLPIVPNTKIDEKNIKSTVKVMIWDRFTSSYISWGTGVIIAPMTIITNYHVLKYTINNPDRYLPVICATLAANVLPDCSFAGSAFGSFNNDKVAHYNENLDLALLSITGKLDSKKNITSTWYLKIDDLFELMNNISLSEHGYGMSIDAKVGDSVDTIGYPADGGEMMSYRKGKILYFGKNSDGRILKIITSARITPGQSGGGAYDENGKFLGVTSAYYPDANGNFLAGVIVPVTTVNLWIQAEQGYRINKKGEYTILDENFEKVIEEAVGLSDSNNQDNINNSYSLNSFVELEKKQVTKIDNSLSKRVSGNILLQVEKSGEGWYVYPDDKKKYYLGRPADAFSIMRNLGLGIKHSELENYLNTKFPSRLSGKIMLDVEQNGEAYYINPKNLKGYFLNRPADAFSIMRELGLGITNSDVRKIDVGEIK